MYSCSAHTNTVAGDLFCAMYLYIPLEATVESLRVASYDAGRALRATKSIIAFLCEIGYFANWFACFLACVPRFFLFSQIQTKWCSRSIIYVERAENARAFCISTPRALRKLLQRALPKMPKARALTARPSARAHLAAACARSGRLSSP